jgi:hypothetical protein
VDPTPHNLSEHDLPQLVQQISVDRARVDAVTARVDALELEVPLGQVEMQEELDRLETQLEAVMARLAKLEAIEPPVTRTRGVIGALRVDRPSDDGAAAPD